MNKKKSMSMQTRRFWVIINYLSIIFILSFFYTGKYFNWTVLVLIGEAASLLLFIVSFIKGFINTKLWRMSHTSSKNLDERQLQVLLNSLKYSYSIFTIITLIIIYGFAVAELGPIDVVLAGCLLYMAHTLPAAIIGWNEKVI